MAIHKGQGYTIEWDADKVLKRADAVLEVTSRKVAFLVKRDAIRYLMKLKGFTGNMARQIKVHVSRYKGGGYYIIAQGSKDWHPPYYAAFLELGHYSSVYGTYKRKGRGGLKGISPVYVPAEPFMRTARKQNLRKAQRMYQDAIDKL